MAASMGEIIKAEAGGEEFRRVGFQELLDGPSVNKREHFLRFRPDGRLPVITPPKKEPEISVEELQTRRLEQMEREVYQKTFAAAEAAGLKAGEEKMEREIHRLLPQLEGVLTNLEQLHVRILAASERFMVETVLILIRELLAYELTIHPEELTARVKRILSRAAGRKEIVIRLSPGNARLLSRLKPLAKLRIEADENLSPGTVALESDFGGLEDNLEDQLKEVELGLREFLQERLDQSMVVDIAEHAREVCATVMAKPPTPLAPDPDPDQIVPNAAIAKPFKEPESDPEAAPTSMSEHGESLMATPLDDDDEEEEMASIWEETS